MTKKLQELKQVIWDGILGSGAPCIITGKYRCCTLKNCTQGTSLVVQQLRIHLAMQGMSVRSLVGELRPHVPWSN